jgi:GWxTD domain-containing protein
MLAVRLLTLAFLASVAGPGQLPGQPDTDLILRAVRSYRAEGGRTEVNAFVQVPYLLMQPTTSGPEGRLSYRVEVRVTDSTGLKLLEQSWQNQATAALRRPDAFAVDMVRFSLAPGRYRLEVAVVDSVSGHRAATGVDLEGFASAPAASDLLLSPQIRPTAAGDTVPRPAELRWGQMLVAAAARLDLTPLRPTAYYLLEAYSPAQADGTLRLRVADSTGKALITTAETPVQVPMGGGVLKGQLDLTGLPPGNYDMVAALQLGGKTVERAAGFTMAGLDETLEKDVVRREAAKVTDEGYFEAMSQEELELAKEPLVIVAESGELSKWSKDLSLRAKRRFLVDFWKRRDPTPDTPVNEARRVFYDGVAYAEKHFGEKGRVSAPGWRTDRGRIYIKYGEPEEQLDRVQAGRAVPYQVWRYRQGRDRYFVFADRSNGIGVYQLVHSNDVKEIGLPNWREIVTQEGVADIGRFLGIDFFDGNTGR